MSEEVRLERAVPACAVLLTCLMPFGGESKPKGL